MAHMLDKNKEIEDFIIFLENNSFDSENVREYLMKLKLKVIFNKSIGIILVLLSITLIVLPLPGWIEIATIYYFNINDGITISDIVALMILVIGLLFLLRERFYKSIFR